MSSESSTVDARHFAYLAERTAGEDAFLAELKRSAEAAGIPAIWISPEQASLMQILLRLRAARDVVEVGTLAGYSAIAMARALPEGGCVRTIELSAEHAAFARDQVARSDVAGRVEVLEGAGADVLPRLADGSADAFFIDADKPGYAGYLREALRILRPRGLVLVDNAFAFGRLFDETSRDADVAAVRAFNDEMAATRGLDSVIVPIGDGLWVGIKR
jgi:predicted O-methyltransferase YrrM